MSPFARPWTPSRGGPPPQERRKSTRVARRCRRSKTRFGADFCSGRLFDPLGLPAARRGGAKLCPGYRDGLGKLSSGANDVDRAEKGRGGLGIPRTPETRPLEFASMTAVPSIPGGCGGRHHPHQDLRSSGCDSESHPGPAPRWRARAVFGPERPFFRRRENAAIVPFFSLDHRVWSWGDARGP